MKNPCNKCQRFCMVNAESKYGICKLRLDTVSEADKHTCEHFLKKQRKVKNNGNMERNDG